MADRHSIRVVGRTLFALSLSFALWLSVTLPLLAQGIGEAYHYGAPTDVRLDDAAARAKLVNWVADDGNPREQHVYFRNTSDLPIEVASYEFYECINVTGVTCGEELTDGPAIQPGETIVLETVRQRDYQQRMSYRYRFQVRFARPPPPRAAEAAADPASGARGGGDRAEEPVFRESGWLVARLEYVDRVMPMLLRNHAVPGAAIVLIEDAEIQWSAGYGVTEPDGSPVTPETIFRAASLGEPVIAHTAQRLADARGWRLDGPITEWAHEGTYPAELAGTSAAELLAHEGPPNGYAFLREAIEWAEGHDLEVLVRALVLKPHGLSSMSLSPFATGVTARGHDESGATLATLGGAESSSADGGPSPSGPSVIHASAEAYARFLINVSALSRRDTPTWRWMTSPRGTISEDPELSWTIGWIVAPAADRSPIVYRRGADRGFASLALVDEARGRGLVILTNGANGGEVIADVFEFLDPRLPQVVTAAEPGGSAAE